MILVHKRRFSTLLLPLILLVLLAGCSSSTTQSKRMAPSPTPTPGQGQQLLNKLATTINTAKTLHSIFQVTIAGPSINGTLNTETWSEQPANSRTVIQQSSISRFPSGSTTVTDGKQLWQYDPQKKVVYTGQTASDGRGTSGAGGQGQFLLTIVRNVFSHSNGTLRSTSVKMNGHDTYEVSIVPAVDATASSPLNFNYTGEMYIDKVTLLPVRVALDIAGIGKALLDFTTLEVNPSIPSKLFTFEVPAGVKVMPLQQENTAPDTGKLTLAQAQQQAGYHLLSIPGDQQDYALLGVDVLGAPGNQIYTLHYMKGNLGFTIAEGVPLANLSVSAGQQMSVRGTTATFSSVNGDTVLAWTEHNVGVRITGKLSQEQAVTIANLLS